MESFDIQSNYSQVPQASSQQLSQALSKQLSVEQSAVPFKQFFDEAVVINQNPPVKPQLLPVSNLVQSLPLSQDAEIIAQAVNQEELDPLSSRRRRRQVSMADANTTKVGGTPFQLFLDKSIEVLENISSQEARVNDLTEKYIAGKISIDEVSIESVKLNMAITFVTTVITTAATTLKELTGMQI